MFRAAWQDGKDIQPEVGLDFCPSPDYFENQNNPKPQFSHP